MHVNQANQKKQTHASRREIEKNRGFFQNNETDKRR